MLEKSTDEEDPDDDENDDPDTKTRMYSANSIKNYRYALNCIIKDKRQIDITAKNNTKFTKSQKAFANAIKELKSAGKGEQKIKFEITEASKHICLHFIGM